MSEQFDKAVRNLNDFLLQHPELKEQQFLLMAQMEGLSQEDKLTFLITKVKENLSLMRQKQQEVAEGIAELNKKIEELNK